MRWGFWAKAAAYMDESIDIISSLLVERAHFGCTRTNITIVCYVYIHKVGQIANCCDRHKISPYYRLL